MRACVGAPADAEARRLREQSGGDAAHLVDCAVCKENLVAGDALRQLPCKHEYHDTCIVQWLKTVRAGPKGARRTTLVRR